MYTQVIRSSVMTANILYFDSFAKTGVCIVVFGFQDKQNLS